MVYARELRFVLVVEDYEAAAHLYRDVFGLEVLMDLKEDGGRGLILKVPSATIELADAEHGGIVDEIEVGRRLGDRVRIAVEVDAFFCSYTGLGVHAAARISALAGPGEIARERRDGRRLADVGIGCRDPDGRPSPWPVPSVARLTP